MFVMAPLMKNENDIKRLGKGKDFQARLTRCKFMSVWTGRHIVFWSRYIVWVQNVSVGEVQAIHPAELTVLEAHTPSLFSLNLLSIWG